MSQSKKEYGLSTISEAEGTQAPELDYLPPRPGHYFPKIGLIGAGGISEYHLRAYRRMGLHVEAICDIDIERARRRQQEFYPDAQVCDDYRQVLACDDIEVVDIATHPEQRVEIIRAAIRAQVCTDSSSNCGSPSSAASIVKRIRARNSPLLS